MALFEQSDKDNAEVDNGGIESYEGTKAANELFTNGLDVKTSESIVQQSNDEDVEQTIA